MENGLVETGEQEVMEMFIMKSISTELLGISLFL